VARHVLYFSGWRHFEGRPTPRFRTIQVCPKSVARKHAQALALSNAHIPVLWRQKAFSGRVKIGASARSSGTIGGMGIPLRPAPDEMIRAERRALLRADASALRNADREVVRTRWRADRNRRLDYFVIIRRGGALGVCSAGEITNVTQAFHPSGRLSWANSQELLRFREPCGVGLRGMMNPSWGPAPTTRGRNQPTRSPEPPATPPPW